jgi:predicted dehydrogenase
MNKLRMAVVGCGHLGRIHARLLSELDTVQLVAAVDPNPAARQAVADSLSIGAYADYKELPGQIDAAVLAAPTSLHAEIALYLMERGIHLLVEKPLATTAHDAQRMLLASARHAVVLAAGHVERFNPAFQALRQQAQQPYLIEAVRTGGFTFRCTDVGVVLDLMIHDLDLVLTLVSSPVVRVDALGRSVLTEHEDLAQARIEFANGCVASLKASRTNPVAERQMTLYEPDQHLFVDFNARTVQVLLRSNPLRDGSFRPERCTPSQIEALRGHVFDQLLPLSQLQVPEANPLRDELADFVDSVQHHRRPRVPAEDALRAVRLAEQVCREIRRTQQPVPDEILPPQRRAA